MSDIKTLLRQAAKPFLFLLTFIFICAFLAHYLAGDETLLEYAKNNPELAYGTQDDTSVGSGNNLSEKELTQPVDSAPSEMTPASPTGKNAGTSTPSEADTSITTDNSDTYTETNDSTSDAAGSDSVGNVDDTAKPVKESDTMEQHPERITYEEGFYYEPLTDEVKERITGISYPENGCTVPYEDLNYVGLKYIDFKGQEQTGELICNKAIAQDMVEIFHELYRNEYRLESVHLIDEYDGDDTASMAENNTSCFNYRVVDGTASLSKHAYGLAIDVNPYYNPYVVFGRNSDGSDYISPPGSEIYADRSQSFAYKIDENDLCYRLFTEHGFTWGGNWNSTKDYQHFQKKID
jgi:hypothetical protein